MFGKKKCKTAGEEEEKEGSSDKSETSDSESESEEESGGGLSEFDVKRSHTCYAYDKKKKIITRNGSGWTGSAVAKKTCDKFSLKILNSVTNIMYGFVPDTKYTQSSSNYSIGHTWYVNSSCLYGSNFYNGSSTFPQGETSTGTIYGAVYNKKKEKFIFIKMGNSFKLGLLI